MFVTFSHAYKTKYNCNDKYGIYYLSKHRLSGAYIKYLPHFRISRCRHADVTLITEVMWPSERLHFYTVE